MSETLTYDFRVVGLGAVQSALRSVERSFAAHNTRMMRQAGAGRGGAYRARPEIEARRGSRTIVKGFDEIGKAARAAYIKEARDRLRAEEQANRRIENERRRHLRRLAAQQEREARHAASARGRFMQSTIGTAGRSVGGSLRAVGGLAMAGLAVGGGFAIHGAINAEKSLRGASAALANQAFNTPGEKRSRDQIQQSVDRQARSLGITSGLGRESVVGGLRNFAAVAGNVGAGQALLPTLTDISQATDADIGDVGKTAGQIFQTLATRIDVSKPEGLAKALKQTEDIMFSMAGQAKVGSIEFKDLSTQMGKLMSATAGFEGDVSDLAGTMGAVAQLAIAGGASSPEEAMTSIMRFRDDIIQNQKRFKAAGGGMGGGVNVFADKGMTRLRNPEEILFDMLKTTKGSLPEVGRLFGVRAQKAVQPFQAVYTEAGGGKAGEQAVMRILQGVRGAKISPEEIKGSAAFRRAQSDVQFNQAIEKFNNAIGSQLLPTVTRLIPEFVKLIPSLTQAAKLFGQFVDTLAKNPVGTIGKIIAAKLVLDIATAGIGKAVTGALVKAVSGTPVAGAGGPASVGLGGKSNILGAAGMGAALGITVGTAILTAGIVNFEAGEAQVAASGKNVLAAEEAAKAGDTETTRRILNEEQKRLAEMQKPGMVESGFKSGIDLLTSPLGALGLDPGKMDRLNRDLASRAAAGVGAKDPSQAKSVGTNVERLRKADDEAQRVAAKQLADAAGKLSAAGDKLAGSGTPNRGNAPSPVK